MSSDRPIMFSFSKPTEKVLFNSVRDVNPFSVMYEAMWTLAGRNDVEPLCYYTRRMRDFSDDGIRWHGAYGHRWRHHFGKDQLECAVRELKDSPNSRRVVLEMWDARVDGGSTGKDYPCNTHCYLSLRNGRLNLTVCNRSNDMVWGLFGTNYVVFGFLLEYLAARLGVEVGMYHHLSNDAHVYDDPGNPKVAPWSPEKWLAEYAEPDDDPRRYEDLATVPLVRDSEVFERELPTVVKIFDGTRQDDRTGYEPPTEPFLRDIAWPLLSAHYAYKRKDAKEASSWCAQIAADDWRVAAINWIKRREKK